MRPKVLVADDDEGIRQSLRLVLEEAGYRVDDAASGAEALAGMRADAAPVVVLLDYLMPEMNGGEVLQQVAPDAGLAARSAYVLITASPHMLPPELESLHQRLAVSVLPKPFDVDILLAAVAQAALTLGARVSATHPPPA